MHNEIPHTGESRKETLINALREHLPEREINTRIAKKAGRTRQMVSYWRNHQKANPVMEKAAFKLLKQLNKEAAEKFKSLA